MAEIIPHPRSSYTAEQIEYALTVLALNSGNMAATVNQLGDDAPTVQTIGRWISNYSERYAEIRAEILPKLKADLADMHTDLAARILKAESEAVDHLLADVATLKPTERIRLVKEMAVAGGIHIDKAQLLRGEPTAIERKDIQEIRRSLAAKGVTIEVGADDVEDVTDAEPVPELPNFE